MRANHHAIRKKHDRVILYSRMRGIGNYGLAVASSSSSFLMHASEPSVEKP